jgi:iron(II)-dependent oxidoreductase
MHTTGLAEPISGLYEGARLGEALADARRRTLAIYGHLDLAALEVPRIALVNPPLWELAHIAWFQEFWCLRHAPARGKGAFRESMLARADALFDSSTVPHATRWSPGYPPLASIFGYLRDSLDATLEASRHASDADRYYFKLALLHEDMHGEALLMTLQTLGLPAPAIAEEPPPSQARPARDIQFAGGEFLQGTSDGEFTFDNERHAHGVKVAPFAMADAPVTQGAFAAFVDDTKGAAPRYWKREGGGWYARRFDRWAAIDEHAPMIHVSLPEALAYCEWAGRRLPTEAEWEFAARNGGAQDRFPWGDAPLNGGNFDLRHRGPSAAVADSAPSRSGLRQLLGGVWEWTSSAFAPYPGFTPGPYREYSEPWFHTHFVLRGGSFATRARVVHNRFRNFYLAERGDPFAGFRSCALEAP